MLGDSISSLGAVITSILIYFFEQCKIMDPICTYLFAVLVILTTYPISRDCIQLLMETTPDGINIEEFQKELQKIQGVKEVHDLHVWQLSTGKPLMSSHIIASNPDYALIKATILCRKRGIYHSTIQIQLSLIHI
eukprot:TRINITY_DN16994_c0_g1_i1.p2 TRINITY_DN16994_c0_g1~~TRINITY_DN16994_c0_g1_i1.p2  ORF type:complete len:135 (+),score=12.45 TRINITY_DN16994_c0_g1_i1:185-589(+)